MRKGGHVRFALLLCIASLEIHVLSFYYRRYFYVMYTGTEFYRAFESCEREYGLSIQLAIQVKYCLRVVCPRLAIPIVTRFRRATIK
jgi:hypothetical protein